MAQRLIRLTLYDEKLLTALDRLSKSRKQSMFVVEALRHFLESVEGQQLLLLLTQSASPEKREAPKSKSECSSEGDKATSNLDDLFR